MFIWKSIPGNSEGNEVPSIMYIVISGPTWTVSSKFFLIIWWSRLCRMYTFFFGHELINFSLNRCRNKKSIIKQGGQRTRHPRFAVDLNVMNVFENQNHYISRSVECHFRIRFQCFLFINRILKGFFLSPFRHIHWQHGYVNKGIHWSIEF